MVGYITANNMNHLADEYVLLLKYFKIVLQYSKHIQASSFRDKCLPLPFSMVS